MRWVGSLRAYLPGRADMSQDSCLDELSGQKKKAAIKIPADKLASAGQMVCPTILRDLENMPDRCLAAWTLQYQLYASARASANVHLARKWPRQATASIPGYGR